MAASKDLVKAAGSETALVAINPDQTLKASKALLSFITKAAAEKESASNKKSLLSEDSDDGETPIWLTITTKRHIADKARLQPGKITLPHPINTNASICLITADPQRRYKDIVAGEGQEEGSSDAFPAELRARITRVVGVEKLKAKFSQYEAQRKLYAEHDVFLADDRIINRLPKILGKTFYKTTAKRPIPVILQARSTKNSENNKDDSKKKNKTSSREDATPAQMAREIQKAVDSALVSLSPTTNTAVRIGLSGMTPAQIAANATAVADALVARWVPQKWRNVRSIHIKGPETAALPLWMTDELWLDGGKDVISNEAAAAAAVAEKANVGKKRKAITAVDEDEGDAVGNDDGEEKKKSKKSKKEVALPEGDDGKLDEKIRDRKAKLRKQKAKAQKAMDE